jgi:hypothetical protein
VVDDVPLARPKAVEAEHVVQQLVAGGHDSR